MLANPRILVVEDEEALLTLLEYNLESEGYTVQLARDGEEAALLIEEQTPDLILLDIQLPGMDGYEVAQEIRRSPSTASTPIVAVTSYAMPGDRERPDTSCPRTIRKPSPTDYGRVWAS